jgi:hypothetical protein
VPLTIAINSRGVQLFRGDCDELLSFLQHNTFNWDSKVDQDVDNDGDVDEDDQQFVVEFQTDGGQKRLMQIITKQASMMDSMVQSFYDLNETDELPGDVKPDLSRLASISYVKTDENV